jgi:hypothetical protein
MKEIRRNRFRPVLVTIFWCSFIFNGIDIDHLDGTYLPEILFVTLLISMLIFQIRERIFVDENFLHLILNNTQVRIALTAIKEISFNDCFNEINITTKDSSTTLNISQFHSRKVEKYFTKNGLYHDDITDDIEYNQSLH